MKDKHRLENWSYEESMAAVKESFEVEVVAGKLKREVQPYGSKIKDHYSDSIDNPEADPPSGMGAANIGPEFTEKEYDGLIELCRLETVLFREGKLAKTSGLKKRLWKAVIESNR